MRAGAAGRTGLILTVCFVAAGELGSLWLSSLLFRHFFASGAFYPPADLECFLVHGALILGHIASAPAGMEPFMYPPTLFLIAAPLSMMPAGWAFAVWSGLGMMLLGLAGRQAGLRPALVLAGLALPPSIYCFTLGQTGLILSALLVLSLVWAKERPLLSGMTAGLMVLKPPFALLLPVCYLASGNWRAFAAAAVTATAACLLSGAVFGLGPWHYFFHDSLPLARGVLQAPWHHDYQNLMASPFMLFRSLGVGLTLAYVLQGGLTLLACGLTWRLWRGGTPDAGAMLLTACLAALATPYDYVYDFPAIGLLLLATWPKERLKLAAALGFIFGTGFYAPISVFLFPTGALLTGALCLACWPGSRPRQASETMKIAI